MKKPTIYEIKRRTEETNPYFFDKKTMRFFGQTLRDFKVYKTKVEHEFLICAPSWGGNTTKRIFNALTNELNQVGE